MSTCSHSTSRFEIRTIERRIRTPGSGPHPHGHWAPLDRIQSCRGLHWRGHGLFIMRISHHLMNACGTDRYSSTPSARLRPHAHPTKIASRIGAQGLRCQSSHGAKRGELCHDVSYYSSHRGPNKGWNRGFEWHSSTGRAESRALTAKVLRIGWARLKNFVPRGRGATESGPAGRAT